MIFVESVLSYIFHMEVREKAVTLNEKYSIGHGPDPS